ncbi:AAA family ATPase, partial [Treponema pallidum]
LIAYLDRVVARYGTFSLDSSAYARLLAYAEELAESHTRLSTSFVQIADLVLESHAVAVDMHPDVSVITAHVVQEALNRRQYVCSRARERFQRMIACGELLVEVQGYRIG